MADSQQFGVVAQGQALNKPFTDPGFTRPDKLKVEAVDHVPVMSFEDRGSEPPTDFPDHAFLVQPPRVGPADRLAYAASGWCYSEFRMDAKAFLSVNEGRLSLRGIPLPIMNEDKWEPAMSVRSLISYWFDADHPQKRGVMVNDTVVNFWTTSDSGWTYAMMNYISPWGNDTCLWDFQVAEIPASTVTIGVLRPLRRARTPPGWYRYSNHLPTRKPSQPVGLPDGVHEDLLTSEWEGAKHTTARI